MKVTSGVPGSPIRVGLLRILVPVLLSLGIATALLFAAGPVQAGGPDGFAVPIILEENRPAPKLAKLVPGGGADASGEAQQRSSAQSNTPDLNNGPGVNAASLNCMGANAHEGECAKLFAKGANGTCGGEERPSMSFEDVKNHIEYRCHEGEGVWVRFQRGRTAAEHEMIKYPVGPCDRQQVVYDPIRDKEFLRINEAYSESECQAHIGSLLDAALDAMKLAWGDGPAVAFCTVLSAPGDTQGNAYGQVYLFTPSGDGHNGTNSLVFQGLYDTAVNYANSASSCNP